MTKIRSILYVIEVRIHDEWGLARGKKGVRVYLDLERCINFLDRMHAGWLNDPNIRIVAYGRAQVLMAPEL